jgi:hypothetical protein
MLAKMKMKLVLWDFAMGNNDSWWHSLSFRAERKESFRAT